MTTSVVPMTRMKNTTSVLSKRRARRSSSRSTTTITAFRATRLTPPTQASRSESSPSCSPANTEGEVTMPDPRIGPFVRLDNIAEIRSLAKAWHNCLVNHLYEVNEGTKLIYLSIEDGLPAVALVVRVHRLGWALAQIKGPRNIDLDRIEASRKSDKFAAAGIPRLADVAAVKDLL